jgi:hypothetical protein
MAEQTRTIEQVRTELETERKQLTEDIAAFREEARAVLPYAAGGVAALALLTKGRGAARAYRLLRLLR